MNPIILLRPSHWGGFIERLRLLALKSAALRNSKVITPEALLQLASDTRGDLGRKSKTSPQKECHAVAFPGSLMSLAGQCNGTSRSALWLPIDLFLEDAMDGTQVAATSAVEILTGKIGLLYCDASSLLSLLLLGSVIEASQ